MASTTAIMAMMSIMVPPVYAYPSMDPNVTVVGHIYPAIASVTPNDVQKHAGALIAIDESSSSESVLSSSNGENSVSNSPTVESEE
jgi:hypothetical protein